MQFYLGVILRWQKLEKKFGDRTFLPIPSSAVFPLFSAITAWYFSNILRAPTDWYSSYLLYLKHVCTSRTKVYASEEAYSTI